jgi:hypothetical protein
VGGVAAEVVVIMVLGVVVVVGVVDVVDVVVVGVVEVVVVVIVVVVGVGVVVDESAAITGTTENANKVRITIDTMPIKTDLRDNLPNIFASYY